MAFDWLERYKQSTQMQPQNRPVSFVGVPRSQRFAVQHTGYGPDGQLQQGAPVAQMPGGDLVHEGEMAFNGPGGNFMLDAAGAAAMAGIGPMPMAGGRQQQPGQAPVPQVPVVPQPSPQEQQQLTQMQRSGAAGRATGGFDKPTIDRSTIPVLPPTIEMPTGGTTTGDTTTGDTATGDASTSTTADKSILESGFVRPLRTKSQPAVVTPTSREFDDVRAQAKGVRYEDRLRTVGVKTSAPGGRRVSPPTDGGGTTVVDDVPNVATPGTGQPNLNNYARSAAMGRIMATMRGGDPAAMAASQKTIDDLNAQNLTEQQVMRQQAAQGGWDASVAAARGADLARTQAGAVSDAVAKQGIDQMQAQRQAAETLATQSLQGQQFDWNRNQSLLSSMITARDYDGANRLLQDLGYPAIDFSTIKRLEQAGEISGAADAVWNMLQSLPEDAATTMPGLVQLLTGTWSSLMGQNIGLLTGSNPFAPQPVASGQYAGYTFTGYDPTTKSYTFTGQNGATQTFTADQIMADPSLMGAVSPLTAVFAGNQTPEQIFSDPQLNALAGQVSSSVMTWLQDDNPVTGGQMVFESLKLNPYFAELMQTAQGDDPAAAATAGTQIGLILSNAYRYRASEGDPELALQSMPVNVVDSLVRAGIVTPEEYRTYINSTGATPSSWTAVMSLGDAKYLQGNLLTEFLAAYDAGDPLATDFVDSAQSALNSEGRNVLAGHVTRYNQSTNAWDLTTSTVNWVVENQGGVFQCNGLLLRVDGYQQPKDRNGVGYVTTTDVRTGQVYYLWNGGWATRVPGEGEKDPPQHGFPWPGKVN